VRAVTAALPFTTSHAEWIGLILGAVSLIGIGGIISMLFCHHAGCLRRGRFRYGHYRLCHVHHPHVPSDGKITREHLEAMGRRLHADETGADAGVTGADHVR
jgi:hypothetical protein